MPLVPQPNGGQVGSGYPSLRAATENEANPIFQAPQQVSPDREECLPFWTGKYHQGAGYPRTECSAEPTLSKPSTRKSPGAGSIYRPPH